MQWSKIQISFKMSLCKKKTVICSRASWGNASIPEDNTNKCTSCHKKTQKQIFRPIKIQLFQKNEHLEIFIADSDEFRALGQDFIMPPSASFTNELLHWLILGDFCRHSFMTSGKSQYIVLSRFQHFQFHWFCVDYTVFKNRSCV